MAFPAVSRTDSLTTSTGSCVLGLSGAPLALVNVSGTYTGVTGSIKGSIDGTNYFDVPAFRTDTGTQESGSIVLSAANRAWYVNVGPLSHLKWLNSAYSTGTVVVTIVNTNGQMPVNPSLPIQRQTTACTATVAVAAGSGNANVVAVTGKGILNRLSVTTAGTASLIVYDNATTNSGTTLYTSLATYPIGTVSEINLPYSNGLVFRQASGSAAVTVGYTPNL